MSPPRATVITPAQRTAALALASACRSVDVATLAFEAAGWAAGYHAILDAHAALRRACEEAGLSPEGQDEVPF